MYDALGDGYTLLKFDRTAGTEGIAQAARDRGVPLEVLDVSGEEREEDYWKALVLVRPDQHIAWRGDREPDNPAELIDLVRGAACSMNG